MPKTRAGSGQVKPNLQFQGTEGITIPVGTTAQRNPTPQAGEIRYNTDLNVFEGYTGTAWGSIGPYPFATVEYFTGDGTTIEFTLSNTITNPDNLIVSMNGVIMKAGQDFDLSYPDRIRFIELDGSTTNAPLDGAEIIVRSFQPITAASIPAGSIGINELDVVDGTSGQFLRTDGAGNLSFATVSADPAFGGSYIEGTVSAAAIKENSITIRELAVSPGTIGQVLATDGAGNLSFVTVSGGGGGGGASNFFELSGTIALSQIPDAYITQAKLDINGTPANGLVLSTDGSNFQWTSPSAGGATASLNNLSSVAINSSLLPASDSTIDLGSSSKKWRDLYLSGSSLYLGTAQITSTGSAINLPAGSTVGGSSISALVNSFSTIAVAGQSNVVADSGSDTLTLVAGSGMTITTDASTDTVTIASTTTAPNLFATFTGNSGTTTANSTTDTLNIVGTGAISTSMSGDTLTISTTAAGVVNSGTASRLAFYSSTGTSVSETASTLTWNNSTGTLTVSNLSTTGSFTVTGTITADEVITTGVGAPTITSGSDITLDAASGAGAVIVDGDLEVSGIFEVTGAATFSSTVSGLTASMVGLGNVTNESKSTMFANPTFTGTVSGVTATHVGLGNVTNESKATMFTSPTFTGTTTLPKIQEPWASLTSATGTVTHDCASNHIFYHTSISANFTANLTNLNLASGHGTNVTLILVQGGTPYIANAVEIAGSAQTINWQGSAAPSGTASKIDIITFSIINNSGTYTVFGSLVSYGT